MARGAAEPGGDGWARGVCRSSHVSASPPSCSCSAAGVAGAARAAAPEPGPGPAAPGGEGAAPPAAPAAADDEDEALGEAEECKLAGNAALKQGDAAGAAEHYSAGLALLGHASSPCGVVGSSSSAPALLAALLANRALARIKVRDFEGACADAQACAALEPRNGKAHYRLGIARRALGRTGEASCALQRALALAPHSAEIWRELRACSQAAGIPQEASGREPAAQPSPSIIMEHNCRMSMRGGGQDTVQNVLASLGAASGDATQQRLFVNYVARHYRRQICDEERTEAFSSAAKALLPSASTSHSSLLFAGAGSLVPALRAALAARSCPRSEGAAAPRVLVLEPSALVRKMLAEAARANGLGEADLEVLPTAEGRQLWEPEAFAKLPSTASFAIVCEAVGEDLLSEGLLNILSAARAALGQRAVAFVPSEAELIAVPLELRTEEVEDLDLSPFNALRRSYCSLADETGHGWFPVRLDCQPEATVQLLGSPASVFSLAFAAGPAWAGEAPSAREVRWELASEGLLSGFAWWFRLKVGETELSNAPELAGAKKPKYEHGWKQAVQYLGEEWPVDARTTLRASVRLASSGPGRGRALRVELLEVCNAPLLLQPVPEPLASLLASMPRGASLPVQSYHFTMVGDSTRNMAYRRAIELTVAELRGKLGRAPRVLDLGAGTGLLGLLAARAGAEVWAVEMNPMLRAVAGLCLARNEDRLEGKVTLLPPMLSTQLQVGHELPHRVDLIVSEVLDADLLSEGVIVSLRHAKDELLAPEGVMLPRAARACYAPMECFPVSSAVQDLDLSAVDRRLSVSCQPFRYESMPHRLLAPPTSGFTFDFLNLPHPRPGAPVMVSSPQLAGRKDQVQIREAGTLTAVGYWFDVVLAQVEGKVLRLPAGPDSRQRTWKQNCRFVLEPRAVQPGDVLSVVCAHDDSAMYFIPEEDLNGQVFARLEAS